MPNLHLTPPKNKNTASGYPDVRDNSPNVLSILWFNSRNPDIRRFWSKVAISEDPNACWNWQGGKDKDGYGFFYIAGKAVIASRFVYELINGTMPKGLIVCHRCDNPSCCNPDHIFVGTHADNARDAYRKGHRSAVGDDNGRAILTERDVINIRDSIESGRSTIDQLAKRYKVSSTHISRIVQRKRWQHI